MDATSKAYFQNIIKNIKAEFPPFSNCNKGYHGHMEYYSGLLTGFLVL